ncbi:phosphoribosyl-AMP cyclohydrolase [Pseudorhodobacter antarcticus]|jgi:phosphoribosyl-AMP cyclohydrolase|uniref:phosphoribosyl-AMP cyclohydrolase n=1 Tax=Pseudorhodobacter antarcticus TaxID=1077947 RepID=A0A1H8LEK4_9RHOB|nr:phosphoribosyl-AMP cyclohydrolase [Pseudorhodobacter antarcticus]SEO03469.1 phosphoribosyl-AMP cyclohydrolase [Pseudorhodobacter antarcticus]
MSTPKFADRTSVLLVEEGTDLAPRFDAAGHIAVVTTDATTGEVLMMGVMTTEALRLTLDTGDAHYWSRSRQCLWRKGATSGLVQRVVEVRVDDDQDAIWLRVEVAGDASCHVGYRSCFYRAVGADGALSFVEADKVFDPLVVYGDAPNPTVL